MYDYDTPESPLFYAVSRKLMGWVVWLLWAGADPRHDEGEIALLDVAWKVGVRGQVARLLERYRWDCGGLEVSTC